ncbi:MAG: DUF11 domain-containing protein [Planctomycetota bacterium]
MLQQMFRSARIAAAGAVVLATLGGCQTTEETTPTYNTGPYRQLVTTPRPSDDPRPAPQMMDEPAPQQQASTRPASRPAPAPRGGNCPTYSPDLPGGYSASGMAFPTGEARSSAIMLHQVMPDEVTLNSEFPYEYHVTNLTGGTLQNVVLMVEDTSNLAITSADPAPTSGGNRATWALGELGPCETRVIRVSGRATALGMASNCITVSYNNVLCAQTRVVQPALAITKTATQQALLCDEIEFVIEVRNTGTGMARNVMVRDELPAGVMLADGSGNSINQSVGDLAPGEAKRITIRAKADRTGTFNNNATASADGGLNAQSNTTNTVITAPALAIQADCTDRQFIGRNFTHQYTVRNTGNGACVDSMVSIDLPAGATVVSTSEGGNVSGGRATWNLGDMAPGASRTVSVTMTASQSGSFRSSATVNCACSEPASDTCTTEMRGIPAILLEVVDENDPVEVGGTEIYTITATNQGSAPDTNIIITVNLPAQQELIEAGGATSANVRGQTITFSPLASLGVGERATWRVTVRAAAQGDVRFAVQMDTDQLTGPVNETEATNLYE